MQRAASHPSFSGPRTLAIAGSLLLVSLSYLALLWAPVITRHFHGFVNEQTGGRSFDTWLPLACGAGLVLGGASALMFVLTQITREAELRPYVSLAPVLAAFSACVLIGLRAELPLPGVSSEHVAVFALAVAVVGGALVQAPRMSAQMLGIACALLPPVSLFGVLWIASGISDPARAVWSLPASTRAFLGLLTLSSFVIAAIATLGRRSEAGLSARLPMDTGYDYQLEDNLLADEAMFQKRGLPGWVIVVSSAAALALAFVAIRVYLNAQSLSSLRSQEGAAASGISAEPVQAPNAAAAAATPQMPTQDVAAAEAVTAPSAPTVEVVTPKSVVPVSREPENVPAAKASASPSREDIAPVAKRRPTKSAAPSRATANRAPAHKPSKAAISKASHAARPTPKARVMEAKEAAPAPVPEKRSVAATPKPAPARADSIDDLAAAAVKASSKVAPAKASASHGDDSLDDLMDSALKSGKKGGSSKKAGGGDSSDDPIFGL